MTTFDPSTLHDTIRDSIAQLAPRAFCVMIWEKPSARLRVIVQDPDCEERDAIFKRIEWWIRTPLDEISAQPPVPIFTTVLPEGCCGNECIITAMPFDVSADVVGILVLVTPKPIRARGINQIVAQRRMFGTLLAYHLEVTALADLLDSTQAVLRTARDLVDNPSPQTIVETLRQNLFKGRISSCAMLLFGGSSDKARPEQRPYVEIQGTWSRRMGSRVGVGVRLYLSDYPALLERLADQQIVYFPTTQSIREQFDPLVNGLLKIERVRSLALIALKDRTQNLGLLSVAADKPNAFQPTDLEQLRLLGEYMTLSTYAQLAAKRQVQQEQHLTAMLNAVHDGVVMVLPFGKGGHVFITNRHFKMMFEVPDEGAEGISLIDLLHKMRIPETIRQELQTIWLGIPPRAPNILRGEFHMVNREGQPSDIEWYSAPVYQEERSLGRVYTFHDVTPERTAQRLRAAFLSRVSHELRTPLTSIRGFAEFILEATGDSLPALAREYTEIILNSARHLNNLFTDMIEITRADAGELKLSKAEAHLPDLIISAVARLELHYRSREQQVVMELDDDLPHVDVDVDKINQVLTNLLSNAIKYSPEGGKIRVTTRLVTLADEFPPSAPSGILLPALLVTIRDQGKGLGRDEVEQVFLPFYRTEDVKKQRIEGVGLGLAVTRSIIEIHRGKIWAAPRGEVRGGCFMFTLPTP
ncbi:MAG: cell wall metabolism sensor histidine kinase WalK [Anaerolineae bacterium]|nr:cell wall metabolism sensor histidine kinase WalK [Anaerolineae bacterium]NUQ03135.1 hypothetical protein [Anaerolineae bacterium]